MLNRPTKMHRIWYDVTKQGTSSEQSPSPNNIKDANLSLSFPLCILPIGDVEGGNIRL